MELATVTVSRPEATTNNGPSLSFRKRKGKNTVKIHNLIRNESINTYGYEHAIGLYSIINTPPEHITDK